MLTCVVLTTDTAHHRYFVNRLARRARVEVVFEQHAPDRGRLYRSWVRRRKTPWSLVDNPYLVRSYRRFDARQAAFELAVFRREVSFELDTSRVCVFENVNDPGCVEFVRALRPDLTVSFGTGLIRRPLLELPGVKVNIHRGILPAYRGLDSDLWASYYRDFRSIGTTVHELDEHFDTGGVVGERRLRIVSGMRAHELRFHTTVLAADVVESILDELAVGRTVDAHPQPSGAGGYYSYIPPLKRYVAIARFEAYARALSGAAE